jgi:hypothetical protein
MRTKRSILAALLLALAVAAPAYAAVRDTTPVRLFTDTSVVGASTLIRHSDSVDMTLAMSGVPAGHVVTVWWVIFNNPEFCQFGEPAYAATGFAGTRCGAGDLGIVPGLTPDPRVDPLVTYAAGHVTGSSGSAAWASYLSVGEPRGQVLIGSAFTNPLGADVHLVVHDHDALANLGNIGEEIHSFGSVPGADLAFAAHETRTTADLQG